MMRCLIEVLFAVSSCLIGLTEAADEPQWFYTELRTGHQIVLTGKAVLLHPQIDASTCGPTDAMVCFESAVLQFAMPRKIGQSQAEWDFHGVTYRLVRKETMALLGRPIVLIVIEQERLNGESLRFYISMNEGLVGFEGIESTKNVGDDAEPIRLHLLENRCGFGAGKNCVENRCNIVDVQGKRACDRKPSR